MPNKIVGKMYGMNIIHKNNTPRHEALGWIAGMDTLYIICIFY
jgi:hypothetical protein